MIFYTYLYLREDGTPYYVGKGHGRRAFRKHRFPVPSHDRIIVQEFLSEEDALFAECFLIALYGREDLAAGRLLNLTDGGDGVSGNSTGGLYHREHGTGIFAPGIAAKGGHTQGRINAHNGTVMRAGSVGGRAKSRRKFNASLVTLALGRHVRWHKMRGVTSPDCPRCVKE